MDQGPLVDSEIDAGAALVREFAEVWPLREAFWYKNADDALRHLYLIVDPCDMSKLYDAYGHLQECRRRINAPDPSAIDTTMLRAGEHPHLADSAKRLARGTVGKTVTHLTRDSEGEMAVEDVYIYPLPTPAAVS